MAIAAATLVQMEREIVELTQSGVRPKCSSSSSNQAVHADREANWVDVTEHGCRDTECMSLIIMHPDVRRVMQAATEEALKTRETKRAEAAAALERRMAAMEAAMAARRTPIAEAKPEAARGPGADLRFQVHTVCRSVDSILTETCLHTAMGWLQHCRSRPRLAWLVQG